jgi:hypothetical protein
MNDWSRYEGENGGPTLSGTARAAVHVQPHLREITATKASRMDRHENEQTQVFAQQLEAVMGKIRETVGQLLQAGETDPRSQSRASPASLGHRWHARARATLRRSWAIWPK